MQRHARNDAVVVMLAMASMGAMLILSSPRYRVDDAIQPLATSATMCALLLAWFQTPAFGLHD